MALTLSKTGIADGQVITAAQITQSIDALTGAAAYNIIISGSLNLTGSVITGSTANITSITGSLFGTASFATSASQAISSSQAITASFAFSSSVSVSSSYALSASQAISSSQATTSSVAESVKVTNNATTDQSFRLLFVSQLAGLPNPNSDGYAQPRFDSGSDGSGLYYNPSTDTLNLKRISGSNDGNVDFFGTSSYAISASYAENATNATNFIPSFVGIDNVTYTASTNPYLIDGNAPFNIYVSQSATETLGLRFTSAGVTSGKQINFTPQYQSTTLNTTFIAISASGVNVYGISGTSASAGTTALADTLVNGSDVNNLTFQYIGTASPPIFPTTGWYLINVNQS